MIKYKKLKKYLSKVITLNKIKVIDKKRNIILISIFIILFISSTNSFNSYISRYYDVWSETLVKSNLPEIQIDITGKLNESFVNEEIFKNINTTFDNFPQIEDVYSITYFNRNYVNLTSSLSDLENDTISEFKFFVFNEQILDNLSISLKPEEAIVSTSLFTLLENRTEVWFTIYNGTLKYSNITLINFFNSSLLLDKFFLNLELSLKLNENWIITSYNGFYNLLRNISPYSWLINNDEDLYYTSIYSLELTLIDYKNLRPINSLGLFNNEISKLTSSIFNLFNNLDIESEFVFSTTSKYMKFNLIDSFTDRIKEMLDFIHPFLLSSILQFLLLQTIFLSLIFPMLRIYVNKNKEFIILSIERGLKNREMKNVYFFTYSSIYLFSLLVSLIFQIIFYSFKTFFQWKELHLLSSILLIYYLFAAFLILLQINSSLNLITRDLVKKEKLKKYSRSEHILILLKHSSFVIIPIIIFIFLFFNFRVLNKTSISVGYIFSLIICVLVFSYGLVQLPKNIFLYSHKIINHFMNTLSAISLFVGKAKEYYLRQKKNQSSFLFVLMLMLSVTLIVYDSSSFHQSKLELSSFGYDAMLEIKNKDLQSISEKVNTTEQIVIYDLPGNDLISNYYLLDDPQEFFEGCKFYNRYFSYYSNEEVFQMLEDDTQVIIASSQTQVSLNLEIGDLYFPFIPCLSQNINFTFIDFASFIPIISSISGENSWILGNYVSNPLNVLIDNYTKVYYSFKLTNNLVLEELTEFLENNHIKYLLITEGITSFSQNSSEFEIFRKNQNNFIVSLIIFLSIFLVLNMLVSDNNDDKKFVFFFSSHGLKPSKFAKISLVSNSFSFLLFNLVVLIFSTGLHYIIALFLLSQNTIFYSLYLSSFSILLMFVPITFYVLLQVLSISLSKKSNKLLTGVKNHEM